VPLDTWDGAQEELRKLRNNNLTVDELFRIADECDAKRYQIGYRELTIQARLTSRDFIDSYLEASSWVIGIVGYLAGCADYFETGTLSHFGWVGLVMGQTGLTVGAAIYQRGRWELDDLAAELTEIAEWKGLLFEIAAEVERLALP
jgi:hypothetical protein